MSIKMCRECGVPFVVDNFNKGVCPTCGKGEPITFTKDVDFRIICRLCGNKVPDLNEHIALKHSDKSIKEGVDDKKEGDNHEKENSPFRS